MENNTSLTRRSIFDIQEWKDYKDLNEFVGQIRLVSQLETKINEFKYNFIRSRLYTFEQLLENDNICWLCFKYISSRDEHITHKDIYSNIIIGTGIKILGSRIMLEKTMNKYTNLWLKRFSPDPHIAMPSYYKYLMNYRGLLSDIPYEDDEIIRKLFNAGFYENHRVLGGTFYENINRKKDYYICIRPSKKQLGRLKYIHKKVYFTDQEKIIDILGGKEFINKLQDRLAPSINKD